MRAVGGMLVAFEPVGPAAHGGDDFLDVAEDHVQVLIVSLRAVQCILRWHQHHTAASHRRASRVEAHVKLAAQVAVAS